MTLRKKLIDQLMRDEGYRLKPYKCTSGKTTIGVGRNLDDVGLSEDEVMVLLSNDIDRVALECFKAFDFWGTLDDDRRSVLLNMCFNLGITRLLTFKQTIKSIRARDYRLAAEQMLDSKWAQQVGSRAIRLSKIMAGE
jgi:lysozyme